MSHTISAIIVNYNAGPLLRGCVDSLVACPLAVQIIVVDNASTDRTAAVARAIDPRITVIHQPRPGVGLEGEHQRRQPPAHNQAAGGGG